MHKQKGRVFLKYVFTYFVVILFVLFCMFPLYVKLESAVRDKAAQTLLENAASALRDLQTEEQMLFNTARSLYGDRALRDVYYDTNPEQSLFYNMTQLRERMKLYFQNLPAVRDVMIYLPKFDYVLTRDYIFTERARFYSYYQLSSLSKDWLAEYPYQTTGYASFACETLSLPDGAHTQGLHYVYSFPMVGDGSIQMLLMITLDADKVASSLLPGGSNARFSVLYDAQGAQLAAAGIAQPPAADATVCESDGVAYEVFRVAGADGRSVTLGVEQDFFASLHNTVLRLICVNILAALAVSLLVAAWFAHRRSQPIERIMEVIRSASGGGSARDELCTIEGTVLDMIAEIGTCKSTIGKLDTMVERSLLEKMFLSGLGPDNRAAFVQYFGEMPLPFCILACDSETLHGGALAPFVRGVAEPLTQQPFLVYPAVDKCYCLLAAADAAPGKISPVLRTLRETEQLALKIGVSNGVEDFCDAFAAAKTAQRRLDAGVSFSGVYVFTHTHTSHASQTAITVQELDTLQRALQSGAQDAADRLLEHLFSQTDSAHWDAVELRQLFFSLRTVYSGVLSQFAEQEERAGAAPKTVQLPNDLDEYEPETVRAFFVHLNQVICEKHGVLRARTAHTLGTEIDAYLTAHFSDAALCACSIADHFGISEKYVFQLVKNASGQTLSDRLCALRIATAVRQLQETQKPIADIAPACGFTSANSMYKVFMRVKGVPPSAYRSK